MAAFYVETSATQSSDGLVVTFTDQSNYSDNDESYDKADFTTNTIVLYDAYGAVLDTLNFLTSDTVTYNQTTDHWFTTVRTLAGIASYSKTEKFPLNRITTNKLQRVLASGCCQGMANEANLCKVNTFMQDALYAEPLGASVRWQQDINNANSYLNEILL
jgi:hypothetical protein